MIILVTTKFFRRLKVKKGLKNSFDLMIKLGSAQFFRQSKLFIKTFDLMKNLVATTKIMRSKLFKLIKLHLWPNLKTFDLMIALMTNKFFRRSKA